MSDNIASPTPDEKEYNGDMTKEEYDKQPESNTGATVERDVDEPNPKTEETPALTDDEKEAKRKHDEIMEAERNQPDGVDKVLPDDDEQPVPDDAKEKQAQAALTDETQADEIAHANRVSAEQREKLNADPKPRSSTK